MEPETGNSAKKMKFSSLNPLIVLEKKVFELIFQHFNFEDVKTSSTVSTLWFETTGNSEKCMKKLNLFIRHPNLASSSRLAQSTFSCLFMESFELFKPKLMAGRSWKKIHLDATWYQRKDLFEIKKQIAQSVESLTITNYRHKSAQNEEPEPQLSFPNLKFLRATSTDGLLFREISHQCKNLKTLEVFSTIGRTLVNQDFVYNIMEANDHLEKITLNPGYLMFIPGAVQRLQFKLKKLKYKGMTEEPHISFYEFIQSQAESLEYLSLSIGFSLEMVEVIFTMTKLKHLEFDIKFLTLHDNWDYVKLEQRPSIRKFRLSSCSNNCEQNRLAKKLVRAMPNLRSLYCSNLNNELMKSISLSCPSVVELEVPSFNVDEVDPFCFPTIKKFKCHNFIPTNLVERIKEKSATQRSTFEELLLLENIADFNRTFGHYQNQEAIYY